VTEALKDLEDNLQRVRSLSGDGVERVGDNIDSTLAQSRLLREELQQLANGAIPPGKEQAGNGQSGSEQGGDQQGGNLQGGYRQGGFGRGGALAGGIWDRTRVPIPLGPEAGARIESDIRDIARAFRNAGSEYRYRGLSARQLNEIRELADRLEQTGLDRNSAILLQEYNEALNLLEQLELRLAQARDQDDADNMRTVAVEQVPAEHQEMVAEYYRRLSRGDDAAEEGEVK
jgi:hypothetical protein